MQLATFFLLGVFSLISQAIILRELMSTFYSNDLLIQLSLGSWIFWTGMGSFLEKDIRRLTNQNTSAFLEKTYLLSITMLPLEIAAIRFFPRLVGSVGEISNLFTAGVSCFLLLCPLCLIIGIQFSNAVYFFYKRKDNENRLSFLINRAYYYETVGLIVAGILFSFIFIFFNEWRLLSYLSSLNLAVVLGLRAHRESFSKPLQVVLGLFLFAYILLSFSNLMEKVDIFTKNFRFKDQLLVESVNTRYGNISITQLGNQFNVYEAGGFVGTQEDLMAAEKTIHLPMCFHKNPKRILFLGTGFNGALAELLKYNPTHISYIELDPAIYQVIPKYLPDALKTAFYHPVVKKISQDPKHFLKHEKEFYDTIIINLPMPSSTLINRFLTVEFFKQIHHHLRPGGIMAVFMPYAPNYVNKPLQALNASCFKSLQKVFPAVLTLPDEKNLLLAFADLSQPMNDPEVFISRFKDRALPCKFITEDYIRYRLTTDRIHQALASFQNKGPLKLNHNLYPSIYYYTMLFFISTFYPHLALGLGKLLSVNSAWTIFFILALLSIFLFKKKWRKSPPILFPVAMGVAGFTLMSVQGILILAFQVFFGNLYIRLMVLISCLMVGIALGARSGLFRNEMLQKKIGLKNIFFVNAFYSLFMLWFLFFEPESEWLLYGLAAMIGYLVGLEFNLINHLYFINAESKENPGVVYAADLLGSCLGLLFTSFFCVPALGIPTTLFLLGIINFLMAELLQHKT